MKLCLICYACLTIGIAAAGIILVPPVSQNVLLNTYPEFQCRVDGRAPHWIVNGTRLNRTLGSVHSQRGIRRALLRQVGRSITQYLSVLEVHARAMNNNTELKCVVFETESESVLLRIQGR